MVSTQVGPPDLVALSRARGVDLSVWPPGYDATFVPSETEEYWLPDIECARPEARDAIVFHKLTHQVRYAWDHSPFYRRKWEEAGVWPATLESLEDLAKFPVVKKCDLRATRANTPPFGDNLCIAPSQVARIHGTSGTTGQPTVFGVGAEDWERIGEAHARIMWGCGLRPRDRIMIGSFFSLYVGSWGALKGGERLGATLFPFGAGVSGQTLMAVHWARDLRPTAFYGTPSYALQNYSDYDQRRQTEKTCKCNTPDIGYDVISKQETSTNTMWGAGSFPITTANNYGHNAGHIWQSINSASYITGSHNIKVGVQFQRGGEWVSVEPNGGIAYTLRNGLPSAITQYASPIVYQNNMHANIGTFVQDQWTFKRLTVTGGVRHDYFTLDAAPQSLPQGLFVPAREFSKTSLVQWKDFNPRVGFSYDLFGDGKTAIKATPSRFIASQPSGAGGLGSNNPVIRSVLLVTRTWNDADRSLTPNCDLKNPLLNGECGQISDLNFGQNNPNAITYNDELTHGLRGANWETTALVQRQLARNVSVTAGYYHRTFSNFMATDNTLVTPADYSHYCITAPTDTRLPDGGGYQVCGLYDINPALFGRTLNVINPAKQYGKQTQIFDGIDLTETIRLPKGATISGGMSWGRTKTNSCFVVDSPGALMNCDITPPMLATGTFVGFVPLPWGMLTSATYRDLPGPQLTATYNVANAQIVPVLGRNLSNGVNGTVNVQLIKPGTTYGPRARQLDLRLSKRVRFGRGRVMANVDIYLCSTRAQASTAGTPPTGPTSRSRGCCSSGGSSK